jgi:hypothetical protein
MTTQQVAEEFAGLCKQVKLQEAADKFYGENIISRESFPGPMQTVQGRDAVWQKMAWWGENNEMHSCEVAGPFVHGDEFALHFALEVTPKGGNRMRMTEVAIYRVEGGKVVEEKFFQGSMEPVGAATA